jgi:hypothetical protein
MDEPTEVFSLRLRRTRVGERDYYDAEWDERAVPTAILHHVLAHAAVVLGASIDGLDGEFSTILKAARDTVQINRCHTYWDSEEKAAFLILGSA